MPIYSLTFDEALREVAEVEAALAAGKPPPGQHVLGRTAKAPALRARNPKRDPKSFAAASAPNEEGSTFKKFGLNVRSTGRSMPAGWRSA
jgi:hypothetical protein